MSSGASICLELEFFLWPVSEVYTPSGAHFSVRQLKPAASNDSFFCFKIEPWELLGTPVEREAVQQVSPLDP